METNSTLVLVFQRRIKVLVTKIHLGLAGVIITLAAFAQSEVQNNNSAVGMYWRTRGNTGVATPAIPVTYGTSTIAATENWIGTTDANDFVIGTNNIERMRVKQTSGNVGIGLSAPAHPLHVYRLSNSNKYSVYGEAAQMAIGIDYQNIGVAGYGRGANGTWGYSAGVVGVGDQANSWYTTGVLAYLGTGVPAIPSWDQALFADANNLGFAGIFLNGFVGIGTTVPTQILEIGTTNAQIYMNSANSNMLRFNTSGVAAPSFTTRSPGTKIVFYPQVSASEVDYAMGITGSTLWSSVPGATSAYNHRWYAGITEIMRLRGDGALGIGIAAPTATRLECYDPSFGVVKIASFRNANAEGTQVQLGSIEYTHDYSSTTDFNNGVNSVGLSINLGAASAYNLQLAYNSAAKPTSNVWTVVSDERLKEDIHPFKDGLEVLEKINPVYWKYNGKARTPADEYGVGIIAQDMQKIAPYTISTMEFVSPDVPFEKIRENIEQYYAYNSGPLEYVVINSVKELSQKQKNTEQLLVNTTEFGSAILTATETEISYPAAFVQRAASVPSVTVSTINNTAQLTITQKTQNGFKVKVVGEITAPVEIDWIAIAKTNPAVLELKKDYPPAEREEMLRKVKLTPGKIRLEVEEKEMQRRKKQEALDKLEEERISNTPMPKEPVQPVPQKQRTPPKDADYR